MPRVRVVGDPAGSLGQRGVVRRHQKAVGGIDHSRALRTGDVAVGSIGRHLAGAATRQQPGREVRHPSRFVGEEHVESDAVGTVEDGDALVDARRLGKPLELQVATARVEPRPAKGDLPAEQQPRRNWNRAGPGDLEDDVGMAPDPYELAISDRGRSVAVGRAQVENVGAQVGDPPREPPVGASEDHGEAGGDQAPNVALWPSQVDFVERVRNA